MFCGVTALKEFAKLAGKIYRRCFSVKFATFFSTAIHRTIPGDCAKRFFFEVAGGRNRKNFPWRQYLLCIKGLKAHFFIHVFSNIQTIYDDSKNEKMKKRFSNFAEKGSEQ